MKKVCKTLSILLVMVFVTSIALSGCGKSTSTKGGPAKEGEPRIKLTMFMGNSGLAHPDGVDPSNNPWINIIEDYANVDLEVEVPNYQDFKTKLELMLASQKLPDIVHSWYPDTMYKYCDEGAFIDLKKYYDKSKPIKKYITEEMMEIAKAPSGGYYRVPMAWTKAPQGAGVVARWDLVKKYNNNKWPESVDEWVNVFRTMHKAEPDSIVLSNRVTGSQGINYGGKVIYYWYGADPYGARYNYETGKVVSNFTLPEYKAATQLMKKMYEEGILDKEFATTDTAKFIDKWNNRNVIAMVNTMDQYTPNVQVNYRLGKTDYGPKTMTWEFMIAPPLKKYPAELKDPKYAEPFMSLPINNHGIYISSSCKEPDRAWRVIEGFACDELYEAIFWGKEGETYTVKDGKRIPDAEKIADKNRYWSLHLALVFGFVDGQEVKKAIGELGCGKEYSDAVYKSIEPIDKMAKKNGISPLSFTVFSEDAKKKSTESQDFITSATVEAIMAKITMEQFDQRVKEFQQKYGFIYDEHTKYIQEHKNELEKKGVNFKR